MTNESKIISRIFDNVADDLTRLLKGRDERYIRGFLDGIKFYLDYQIRILQDTKKIVEKV